MREFRLGNFRGIVTLASGNPSHVARAQSIEFRPKRKRIRDSSGPPGQAISVIAVSARVCYAEPSEAIPRFEGSYACIT